MTPTPTDPTPADPERHDAPPRDAERPKTDDPVGVDAGLNSMVFNEDGTVAKLGRTVPTVLGDEVPDATSGAPADPGMIPAPGTESESPPETASEGTSAPRDEKPVAPAEDLEIVRDLDAETAMAQVMMEMEERQRPRPPVPPKTSTPAARPQPAPEPEPKPEPDPDLTLHPREREELLRDVGFLEPDPVYPVPEEVALRPAAPPTSGAGAGRVIIGLAAAAAAGAATILASRHVEPFSTWYYVFAWYPFLLMINSLTAARSPRHSVFSSRIKAIVPVLLWSVPVWMLFEVFNFRLQNWYYVGVPAARAERWIGTVVSFATVLPGVFFLEELLRAHGAFGRTRTPQFRWSSGLDRVLLGAGIASTALVLAVPHLFYPLVWGIPVLLIEPWLRRQPVPSLARDLSDGRPGRILRLLVAGMICGLVWETANTFAGGKWIYTVPGLDPMQPFEMPLWGFLGFAPFALCLWSMARGLVALGLVPDWERVDKAPSEMPKPPTAWPRGRRFLAGVAALAFTLVTLVAMDRWTVDSVRATASDIPHLPEGVADYAEFKNKDHVRGVLELIEAGDLYVPGASMVAELSALEARCHLILLAGIGAENARRLDTVGIGSIEVLAATDPAQLTRELAALGEPGWKPHPRRVAGWVREAQAALPGPALIETAPEPAS